MCSAEVLPMQLKISEDAQQEFKELMGLMKDSTEPEPDADADADATNPWYPIQCKASTIPILRPT